MSGNGCLKMPRPEQLERRQAVKDPDWTFLSNYAHVLVCLAENPEARLRDVAERVGITTAAATAITSTRMLTCATR